MTLKVEARPIGQFAIVRADVAEIELGDWANQYVCLSGYCGPYRPSLFAAAPELLDALVALVASINDIPRRLPLSVGPLIIQAEHAIAKATGQ
jgi:hypothetical protein